MYQGYIKLFGTCIALTAASCAKPAPQPPRPVAEQADIEPMTGPSMAQMPVARQGAALISSHYEPVLRFRQPAQLPALSLDPTTPPPVTSSLSASMATYHTSQPVQLNTSASTSTIPSPDVVETVAQALRHFCGHWAFGDDLTTLVAAHIIEPGGSNSDACAQQN